MSTRKRRRGEAFSDDGTEQAPVVEENENLGDSQLTKEQEVWDAIREAHYEAIEQLPLTLERHLSLMRKLDEQCMSMTSRLFPTLQRYIKQRKEALLGVSENEVEVVEESSRLPESVEHTSTKLNGHGHAHTKEGLLTASRMRRNGISRPSPRNSTPGSLPPEIRIDPQTTREILTHIGCISEELLRASQEKVNLAQTNYDSVDRHIRLLDQAISEQKASMSIENGDFITGMALHLPEVVAPEGQPRKSRTILISDDELYSTNEDQAVPVPEPKKGRSRASQRKSKKKGKERVPVGQSDQIKDCVSLTITLPATTQQDDNDVQAPEELYCYCNRVSFGDMIACDNNSCEREWFHLGCVGLTEIPEGEWFCKDCREGKV